MTSKKNSFILIVETIFDLTKVHFLVVKKKTFG